MGKSRSYRNGGMTSASVSADATIKYAIAFSRRARLELDDSVQPAYFIARGANVQPQLVTMEAYVRLVDDTVDPGDRHQRADA
jgi:hypothetical protein